MLGATVVDYFCVGGGAILTLALGIGLLYWIDAEWHTLDQQLRRPEDASPSPTEAPAQQPPSQSADPPD